MNVFDLLVPQGKVLVKPIQWEEAETSTGIKLAQPANSNLFKGEIISSGPSDKSQVDFKFPVGGVAYFQTYSGVDIELNGEPYKVVAQTDILLVEPK